MRAVRRKVGEVLTLHGAEYTVKGHDRSYTLLESADGEPWTVSTEHVKHAMEETERISEKERHRPCDS